MHLKPMLSALGATCLLSASLWAASPAVPTLPTTPPAPATVDPELDRCIVAEHVRQTFSFHPIIWESLTPQQQALSLEAMRQAVTHTQLPTLREQYQASVAAGGPAYCDPIQ